ncbi:MAG: MFS transporter [Caldilineaceae bacterium SB0668_bin_21]|nr:MFS transporter [Caldilineaceae bacterium SB0668_bin_21]MYC19914.1 MFS transporter [Caldilineaceae bacterium SB0662_bin_25]
MAGGCPRVPRCRSRRRLWLDPLAFGLVNQITGSLRPAIVSIILFFVVGLVLLRRVDVRRAIAESGNRPPAVI